MEWQVVEEFQKDGRGVCRGACSKCDECRGYDGSSSGGKKCKCQCPPAKHVNLDLPGNNVEPKFSLIHPVKLVVELEVYICVLLVLICAPSQQAQ